MPSVEHASTFLGSSGNHCLIAYVDGDPAGFVTGIEISHPDKPTEMLLYELGVDPRWRRIGIGRALVAALGDVARDGGLRGMWVLTEPDNHPARATYEAAAPDETEGAVVYEWRFDHG
jgi:ribosomal protein S18 acetylase RimI-like enzyme